ncbi:hypothetical protein RZO55_00975 [Clostridium boliviensis]|uniref:Uncharacterized protein n=1 Tax=Clostridium boliviensis TaxID=318465 RepID=A0ABU4GEX1_9CLOT|nr:hypothetical protein [Clostridium boliviensis]MDW2796160.1 hypothetical protein [Clostridium boliviensis]
MKKITDEKLIKEYLYGIVREKYDIIKDNCADIQQDVLMTELALFVIWREYVNITELVVTSSKIKARLCKRNDKDKNCYIQLNGDILLPFDSNKGSLNKKRASCAGYNDNLFVFFESLEELYKKGFMNDDDEDKVKNCICEYKFFWDLFGEGEIGYKHYLDSFCLNDIRGLKRDYSEFYLKRIYSKVWRDDNFSELESIYSNYESLLKDFHSKRKKLMIKRLQDICTSVV